jgi:site-specific recombinase XerD
MPTADEPMPKSSLQMVFKQALRETGIHKKASVHTLRQSYAPHLLEAGINLRLIQIWLDHNTPTTTRVYTHLTAKAQAMATVRSVNAGALTHSVLPVVQEALRISPAEAGLN